MDSQLFSDLIRQCWDTQRLTDRMHHDLPDHFRKDWQELPWRRYRIFYGVLVPVIIHDALFRLHGTTITGKHRKVITAQALITGLFDDLFDRLQLPPYRIRQLIETPDYIISSDYVEEHLCQYLYLEIDKHFTGIPKFMENSVQGIMKAQNRSLQQQNQDITIEEVLRITREKGGQAVLFYRSCIDQDLTEDERDFLYDLGGLFQMTNDINDALSDKQAGEITFMTMGLTLPGIREIFDAQVNQAYESWKSLTINYPQDEAFFSRINILVSRSLLTLDRYARLSKSDEPFDIEFIPRNQVLSELAVPREVRKWLGYYTGLNQQVKKG